MPETSVFTESFEQFSARLTPLDLVLWGVAGFIIYTVFVKDNVSVVSLVKNTVDNLKNLVPSKPTVVKNQAVSKTEDEFFALISSWKQTRDLAEKLNCVDAVKVIDQMFPYLSPGGCVEKVKDKV